MATETLTGGGVALRLIAVFGLVFLNGFFVAAEFAIVKVRSTQLASRLKKGDRRAERAEHIVRHLDAYLSATQLGITLASLGLGWIGEPAVARLLLPLFAWLGIASPAVVSSASFALAFGIITFLHIVLGELAPKSLAIQRAEATTLNAAAPLHFFFVLFRPAIWALNGLANRLLRLVGIAPVSGHDMLHSEEELRILLAQAGGGRVLSHVRKDLLLKTLELKSRLVHQIMVPRPQMTILSTEWPLERNLEVARESGYTRFPLVEGGDVDKVVGMVHLKDLVWFSRTVPSTAGVAAMRREMPLVPEGLPVEELLTLFLARHAHMAVVVDEFGGTAGLVTLEDVFEEIVGEIQDEFDQEAAVVSKVGEDAYLVDGSAPLHRVSDVLGTPLESGEVTTIGGYVVEQLGRVPLPGTEVRLGEYRGVVRASDRKRVKTLYLQRVPRPDAEA